MKTIREWFNELPDPYRTQAINNADSILLDNKSVGKNCVSLLDALEKAFIWENSPEDFQYWVNLYKVLKSKNIQN